MKPHPVQRQLGQLARTLRRELRRLEELRGKLSGQEPEATDAMGEGERPQSLEFYLLGAVEIYLDELRRIGEDLERDLATTAESLVEQWQADRAADDDDDRKGDSPMSDENREAPDTESLRPERIQSRTPPGDGPRALKPERVERRLTSDQMTELLAGLPGWRLSADGLALETAVAFPAFPLAVMFVNLVGALAEITHRYPRIEVDGPRVSLRLVSPRARGLTDADFELARAIGGGAELGGSF